MTPDSKVGVLISTVADDGGIKTTQAELTVLGDTAKKSSETATSAFDSFNRSLKTIGSQATSVGRDLSTYISLPIAAVGIGSLKMAGDFQQSLNVLQSVTGATKDQMTKLGQEAKDLGNDVSLPGLSAKDAAAAMTELAKAGLSVNDVMSASKGVLSLAKAGQLDVADAATTTARALNAFQLSGDQAGKIADLLSAAANASTASVSDMSLGLEMAGAQSHQMGVSLQDTVTALSLFSNAGINGSDAGTSLKQMFLQLATPTSAASALMKKLGLDFFDAKGNFIGLSDTSEMLRTKLSGLTQEQRNYTLATIFGSDATRVASILAQGGSAAFDKMSISVNKSGAATALAAAQNKGFNGALDNLKSTAETAMIEIGTKLLPTVTKELKSASSEVSKLTDWFNGLSDGQQKLIFDAAGIVAVTGPIIFVFGTLAKSLSAIIDLNKTVWSGLKKIPDAIDSIESGLGKFGDKVGSASSSFGEMAKKWGDAMADMSKKSTNGAGNIAKSAKDTANEWKNAAGNIAKNAASTGATIVKDAASSAKAWIKSAHDSEIGVGGTLIKMSRDGAATAAGFVKDAAVSTAAWVKSAAVTSVAWTKSAAASSYAWVTVELPKITKAFILTSASASKEAVLSSAAWIKSAVLSSAAWVAATAKQIAAMVAATAMTVKEGAVQGAVWIAQAAKVGIYAVAIDAAKTSTYLLGEMTVATGATMAGVFVGLVADVVLVYKAIQSVIDAYHDVQAAKDSAANEKTQRSSAIATIENNLKNGTPQQQASSRQALHNLGVAGYASGTSYARGGITTLHEQGPEVVDLPSGSRVYPARQSASMMGGNTTHNHFTGNIVLGDAGAVKQFFRQMNADSLLASKGMSVRQGN